MKHFKIPIVFLFIFLAGCKEEYYPKVKSAEQSVLVVEGTLNSGAGATTIRLTRTFKLDDSAQLQPVNGATLVVEGKNGSREPIYFTGDGHYVAQQLSLQAGEEYRLHITAPDGREYASDFVPVVTNPPIDSLNWKRDEEGVTVYVNTHNPENDTRFYRWEYDETWEIRSYHFSYWKMENGNPVRRQQGLEDVYYCWKYFNSSQLLLSSTTQLSSDVVFQRRLLQIPESSEKLGVRYSVLVRQFALTKEAYAFYELMKKNTESLGTIFDAQPSEITGNIHSLSDPAEPVIGYVTAAPAQEKRLFISKEEVPSWGFRLNCVEVVEVDNFPDSIEKYFTADYAPYNTKQLGPVIEFYYGAEPACTDCTVRGGNTQRPTYW